MSYKNRVKIGIPPFTCKTTLFEEYLPRNITFPFQVRILTRRTSLKRQGIGCQSSFVYISVTVLFSL